MPTLTTMQGPPGPETVIDGRSYLYFGGTSYLGLAAHPEVIAAGCAALRRFGVHSATTRARFGTIPPVRETEERAAAFFGCDDAFYFGSGYAANHVHIAAALAEAETEGGIDAVLVDEGAHYCLLEAARLSGRNPEFFAHRDPNDLARRVRGTRGGRVIVMADAIGPSSGLTAPVVEYLDALSSCRLAILVLDDAHGFGVLGAGGRGLLEQAGLWDRVNRGPGASENGDRVRIRVGGTLAKALGGFGGIIPGTRDFVAHARASSHYFDGASAPPSAAAGSTARALEIALAQPGLREHLRANSRRLRAGLVALGLDPPQGETAHFGVTIGDAATMERIHRALLDRGILVPYIGSYTGIPPAGVLRFAVFASHSDSHIDRLLEALEAVLP